MPPGMALVVTLRGSNYRCLEQIFMVPKGFEPLKFDCIKTVYQLFLNKRHVEVYELEKISGFSYGSEDNELYDHLHKSQRTTKLKIRLVRPAKTQISLRIRAV